MRRALLAAFLFLGAFGLNLATLSPAVHPDDSPETVTAGATLSIQHPPGYPLHSMLGRLAVLSLPGGAAFRVNLLSAFFGALGLLLFAFTLQKLASEFAGRELGLEWALAPSAVLAASYSLWFQSSIAKGGIYSLNFALTQATLLALLWARGNARPQRGLLLAALFFGLGMANHWTSQVVLLPGYALVLAEMWRSRGFPKPGTAQLPFLALAAFFGACGLSLYVYLPIRALQMPAMSWGEPWTLKGFLWVFNRAQYAGLESGKTWSAFMALMNRIVSDLNYEFHGLGLAAIALGWGLLIRKRAWISLALLSMPLTLALAVAVKANPPSDSLWIIDPYLLPLYSGLALGLAGLLTLKLRPATGVLAAGALGLGLWHWPMASQRGNFLGYDYANNLFLSAPKNSLLFCEGDSNTALPFYYRHVLKRRHDVASVATVLSDYPWYMQLVENEHPGLKIPPQPLGPPGNIVWMALNNPSRPTLLTNSHTKEWVDPKRVLPRGLLNRLLPQGPPDKAGLLANRQWKAYALRGAFSPAHSMDPLTVRLVRDNYRDSISRLAYAFQEARLYLEARAEFQALGRLMPRWAAPWVQAGNSAYFQRRLDLAAEDWTRAVQEEPQSAEALANLGLYYFDVKNYDQSMFHARKALEQNPGLANARELLEKSRLMLNQAPAAAPQQEAGLSGTQWAAKADQFAQKGEATQALKAYDSAMRLGFVSAGVHRNRAIMHSQLKQTPQAIAEMKKALALEPKNAELRKYLGVMLANAGEPAAALAELQESLRLNPADEQVKALISQIQSKPAP